MSRRSPWRTICVFDPDGTGHDFGYTVGLADLGHPELHMWARPTHGSDPGADFKLTPQDIRAILGIHAELLLSGDLAPGSRFSRHLDAGMAEARIAVGDAVDPNTVEAFGVRQGAEVLPMRWELIREPEGRSAPVPTRVAEQIQRLAREWRQLVEDLGGAVRPSRIDTDHTQHFGPWTPAIEAARDAVGIVGAMGELSWCIDALGDRAAPLGHSTAVAAALARRHGRTGAFESATAAALADAEQAITPRDSLWVDMSEEEIDYFLPEARHLMEVILSACYGHLVIFEHLAEFERIDSGLVSELQATVLSVIRRAACPRGAPWMRQHWQDPGWSDAG